MFCRDVPPGLCRTHNFLYFIEPYVVVQHAFIKPRCIYHTALATVPLSWQPVLAEPAGWPGKSLPLDSDGDKELFSCSSSCSCAYMQYTVLWWCFFRFIQINCFKYLMFSLNIFSLLSCESRCVLLTLIVITHYIFLRRLNKSNWIVIYKRVPLSHPVKSVNIRLIWTFDLRHIMLKEQCVLIYT